MKTKYRHEKSRSMFLAGQSGGMKHSAAGDKSTPRRPQGTSLPRVDASILARNFRFGKPFLALAARSR